ncbi:MAG: LOG family protein [Holosporales bacterium]|nr:LOG family protein [Holosporales bacterium]
MTRFVGVFCGASSIDAQPLRQEAFSLGAKLASLGCKIFYGGGTKGLSEALLERVISHDHNSITAVVQKHELDLVKSTGITCHEVASVSERKDFILSKSEKVFILPGGLGTLDELAYCVLRKQSGEYAGDIILVDSTGYWAFLDDVFEKMASYGFIKQSDRGLYKRISGLDDINEGMF